MIIFAKSVVECSTSEVALTANPTSTISRLLLLVISMPKAPLISRLSSIFTDSYLRENSFLNTAFLRLAGLLMLLGYLTNVYSKSSVLLFPEKKSSLEMPTMQKKDGW